MDTTTAINLALAFVEGFGLILSPCILPILPIVLSISLIGTVSRPVGIIVGFVAAFTIVTFSVRTIISFLHVGPDSLRYIAFTTLLILGIIMMSTFLTEKFSQLTSGLANVGSDLSSVKQTRGGFFSGLVFGILIGVVWTPCAGPIIAAVIVQVAIQNTTWRSVLTVIAFAVGAGAPMLLIALLGRQIIDNFHFLKAHLVVIRKLLGFIIIVTVCYLFYMTETAFSFDKQIKTNPLYLSNALIGGTPFPYSAPAIAGIEAWVNSPPLTLQNLHGKVILIDFWTYSCINCIRTLPYLKNWYSHYHSAGLEIIGVHSPEFGFEHDFSNVQMAVKKFGILYPVALDNQFVTWRNYQNNYWPAQYLINRQGQVVYQHVGEGDEDITENNIRVLLGISKSASAPQSLPPAQEEIFSQTPETYVGYARAQGFASPQAMTYNRSMLYTYPDVLTNNEWALQGSWLVQADKVVAVSAGSSIKLHFTAAKVFVVMGSVKQAVTVKLKLNDVPLSANQGEDVNQSEVVVNHNQLYALLRFPESQEGTIEIIATQPGLAVYTFTFGN